MRSPTKNMLLTFTPFLIAIIFVCYLYSKQNIGLDHHPKEIGIRKMLTRDEFYERVRNQSFGGENHKLIGFECIGEYTTEKCHSIHDVLKKNKIDGNWIILRGLYEGMRMGRYRTSSYFLKTPEILTDEMLDTRLWDVEDGIETTIPNAFLFRKMIQYGNFDLSNPSGKIVEVGVATGGLLTYVTRNFPNFQITGVDINPLSNIFPQKWFGYKKTKNSDIVIGDGAEYIINLASKNESLDGILVDSSGDKVEEGIIAPARVFLTDKFLEAASKILAKTGVLVYDALEVPTPRILKSNEVQDLLKKYFKTCVLEKITSNYALTCTNNDGTPRTNEEMIKFSEKFKIISHY